MRHPQRLTSLSLVRDVDEKLVGVAIFSVTPGPNGTAAFHTTHRADRPKSADADLEQLIAPGVTLLGELPDRAPLRLRQSSRTSFAMTSALGDLIGASGMHFAQGILIACPRQELEGIADSFALPLADEDAPLLEQARRCLNRAQIVWLYYLWTSCLREERRQLTAAWEAWRALERARPLPF